MIIRFKLEIILNGPFKSFRLGPSKELLSSFLHEIKEKNTKHNIYIGFIFMFKTLN